VGHYARPELLSLQLNREPHAPLAAPLPHAAASKTPAPGSTSHDPLLAFARDAELDSPVARS
jgi:hypothetical protein